MRTSNYTFLHPKNHLYSKPVKDLQGYEVGYGFAFNGKENDDETQTQDYGFRIYNTRLGKFLSVDPLTKSYPYLTPYAFAENDVISSIDLDGLEKYRIVSRSFAPLWSFSDTHFESIADGRTKFQIANFRQVSARIHTAIDIDLDKWLAYKYISSQATVLKDLASVLFFGGKKAWEITDQGISIDFVGEACNKHMNLNATYFAKNGTNIGPGIDIQQNFNIFRDDKNNTTEIFTQITGNVFPAQETMIFDQKGTGLFLGTSTAIGNPLTGVWNSGRNNVLDSRSIKIQTDDDGNFKGVLQTNSKGEESVISPDAYNKQFTLKKVWDQQTY